MKKVKVGIVGLGNHAMQPHLAKLMKMPEVEIVGGYDPNIFKFKQVKGTLGLNLRYCHSYGELCSISDAVIICSPDKAHYLQLMIAAHKYYGCHVLVEKPILTDKSQIAKFQELLLSTDKVITTCHPRRFDAMYVRVKELVPEYREKYGRVKSFWMEFDRQAPSENERRNYHDSLLSDHLCHELDYLNFVLGCQKIEVDDYFDSYDHYDLSGKREDGTEIFFCATRRLPKGSPSHERLIIKFEHAVLEVDNLDGSVLRNREELRYGFYDDSWHWVSLPDRKVSLPKTDHNAKYEALNRNFIDSILGKAEPYLSKEEILMAATLPLDYVSK